MSSRRAPPAQSRVMMLIPARVTARDQKRVTIRQIPASYALLRKKNNWLLDSPVITNYNSSLSCLCRKQEELVYSVRKRLEEALMADMLAHVEEAATEGEALKEEGNGSEDMESV